MAKITKVTAREILDSRGNPTVEVTVALEDGSTAIYGVPSGASTGKYEAIELRDKDARRYNGLGVLQAVKNVNTEIRNLVIGKEAGEQKELDAAMIALDGTENKGRLGANAILGVSLAAAKAQAISEKLPLYRYIAKLYGKDVPTDRFPMPMFNIMNGGQHSDSGLSVQEFKIVPYGIAKYSEQLRAGSEVFHALKKILSKENLSVGVGDEGGFAPHIESHARAFEVIHEAIRAAGYEPGKDIAIALDVAANSFYDEKEDQYYLQPENVSLSRESIINLYREWIEKYSIISIEDGLHDEDWTGWPTMKEKLEKETTVCGKKTMLIGDDILVTNPKLVQRAIDENVCNAVLIKFNQIGTVTETLECIALAHANGYETVVSHRSGETCDDSIADLAVGTGSGFIKTGSLSRGERLAKYNRLLAIAAELEK